MTKHQIEIAKAKAKEQVTIDRELFNKMRAMIVKLTLNAPNRDDLQGDAIHLLDELETK